MKSERTALFLKELKKTYPSLSFEIVRNKINSAFASDQPLYNYSHRESIKVNKENIQIEWLPHIVDMTDEQLEYILERCKREVESFKNPTKKKNITHTAIESYKKNSMPKASTVSSSAGRPQHA
jgi:hypothetical protein